MAARIAAFLLLGGLSATTFAGLADDQYRVAARHYSQSRWRLAVEEFQVFLKDFPDDSRQAAVTFFLAESHVQLGQFSQARQQFGEYLKQAEDGKYARKALFRLGETAYLAGDHEQAVEILERFRQQYPEDELNSYLLTYLGEISLEQQQFKLAEEFFSEGLKQFPDGVMADECRYGLARSLELMDDKEAAIRFYRFLGQREARSSLSDDAQLQLAILLYEQQRFQESIEALQDFHTRFPNGKLAAHAWYWLGTGQLATGQWAAASQSFAEGIERFPRHELTPAMAFSRAESFRHLEDSDQARRHYRQVVERWPDSRWADDGLQSLVQLAWRENELPQVDTLADEFLQQFPSSSLRWLVQQTVGRAHLKRGHFVPAVTVFESLVQAGNAEQPVAEPATQNTAPDRSAMVSQEREAKSSEEAARVRKDPANQYYLALAYLGLDRFQDALDTLAAMPDISQPEELVDGVLVARAAAQFGLERHEQAIESLQQFLAQPKQGPDVVKCRAQLAVSLAELGRWPEALEVFANLHRLHSDDALYLPTVQYLAESAYRQNRSDDAARLFQELASDDNPSEYRTRGLSGLAWLAWDAEDGASRSAATFDRLLREYPESPRAAEAALMRGRSLERMGNLDAALGMYRLVSEQYPNSKHRPESMLAAARIHDQLEQDRDAETLLKRLLETSLNDQQRGAALYQLAWVLSDLERAEEADRLFDQLRTKLPTSQYWSDATYRLAERAARAKQFERADQLAQEIVAADSDSQMVSHALYLRGQLAASRNRWQEVVTHMGTVINRFPDTELRMPAEYWLADARYRLREYQRADELLEQLERRIVDRSDAWIAMIPLRRAQVAAHQRRWSDAFEIARTIAARFPDFRQQYEVDYLLGRCYARRAEFEAARQAYQAVVDSAVGRESETAAMAQWMIGETFFLQKRFDEAIHAYYRVEALYDFPRWQAAALLQAGKCQEMQGDWESATELYSQVVRQFSDTKFAERAALRLRLAQQRGAVTEMR